MAATRIIIYLMVLCLLTAGFAADTTRICATGTSSRANVGSVMSDFCRQIGIPVYTKSIGYNGSYGSVLADTVTMGLLFNGTWDYAWLMTSQNIVTDSAGFMRDGAILTDSVRRAGMVPILWMRRAPRWVPVWDSAAGTWKHNDQDRINDWYWKLATETNAAVAPSGEACAYLLREEKIPIFIDATHPTDEVILMNAFLFFSLHYKRDPFGLTVSSAFQNEINAPTIHLLRNLAWNTVMSERMDPFRLLVPGPVAGRVAAKIDLSGAPATLEAHLTRQLGVDIEYTDGSKETGSRYAIFNSLDPAVAEIDYYGRLTTRSAGTARITAWRERFRDTVTMTVTASTALLDSVSILPAAPTSMVVEGFKFTALGHFHKGADTFTINIDDAATWMSSDTGVMVIERGYVVRKSGRGGSLFAAALMDGRSDTVRFSMAPALRVLKRINFQEKDTLFNPLWEYDCGDLYTESKGFGWVGDIDFWDYWQSEFNVRYEGAFPLTNTMARPKDTTKVREFKINVPDGNYLIKICAGHYFSSGMKSWVAFGSDTLARHVSSKNDYYRMFYDSIELHGQQGLSLKVYGSVLYLVLISDEGVNIDSVAYDRPENWESGSSEAEQTMTPLAAPSFLSARPNPFSAGVRITFPGGLAAKRLTVHDISGRRVADLTSGLRNGAVIWNTLVPAGVYFLKVEGDHGVRVCPVLKIR